MVKEGCEECKPLSWFEVAALPLKTGLVEVLFAQGITPTKRFQSCPALVLGNLTQRQPQILMLRWLLLLLEMVHCQYCRLLAFAPLSETRFEVAIIWFEFAIIWISVEGSHVGRHELLRLANKSKSCRSVSGAHREHTAP